MLKILQDQTPADAQTPTPPPEEVPTVSEVAEKVLEDPMSQMEELLQAVKDFGVQEGPTILAAIAILFFGWIAARIVTRILRKIMTKAKIDDTLISFLVSIAYMGFMIMVVITAVGELGVPTTSFVAVLGAAGLAVGFAMQDSLSNFASGVMLILFRPFKKGDFIEGGGVSGTVEEIEIFCTMLKSPDNKKVIVPNSSLTGDNIVNYSAKEVRRVDMVFGIGYEDDIKLAKKTLEEILDKDDRILDDPAYTVAVSELADSSVNFVCRPWVKTADYWGVWFDIHETVKLTFDARGISIPFPQQDVHMHQISPAA